MSAGKKERDLLLFLVYLFTQCLDVVFLQLFAFHQLLDPSVQLEETALLSQGRARRTAALHPQNLTFLDTQSKLESLVKHLSFPVRSNDFSLSQTDLKLYIYI